MTVEVFHDQSPRKNEVAKAGKDGTHNTQITIPLSHRSLHTKIQPQHFLGSGEEDF